MAEFIEKKPQDVGEFTANGKGLPENSADLKGPEFVALDDVEVADIQSHSEEAANTSDAAPEIALSKAASLEKGKVSESIVKAAEMTTEIAIDPDNSAIESDFNQDEAAIQTENDTEIGSEEILAAETNTAESAQVLNSADTIEQRLAATEDSPEESANMDREADLQSTEANPAENLEINNVVEEIPQTVDMSDNIDKNILSGEKASEVLPPKVDIAVETAALNEDEASVRTEDESEDELPSVSDVTELPQNEDIPDETASGTGPPGESGEDIAGINGAVSVGLNSIEASEAARENGQDSKPDSTLIQQEIPAATKSEGSVEKGQKKQSAENEAATQEDTEQKNEDTLNTAAEKADKESTKKENSGKKNDTHSNSKPAIGKYVGVLVVAGLVVAVFFSGNIISALKIKLFKESTLPIEASSVIPVIPEKIQVVEERSDTDRESGAIKDEKNIQVLSFQEADTLREALLLKADEIIQLRQYYTDKISEIEQAVEAEVQKIGMVDFSPAMKVKRIELNLQSIQRRQMYIDKLEQPLNWVESGSEEILYLKRKALLDDQVAEIADGVDMKKHLRHINSAIQKYRPTADKLMIDTNNAETVPLETIWNRITAQNENVATIFENEKDKLITEEICSGNLTRVTEITTLTTKGAECISEIPGTELFLNRISQITPSSAEHLFKWDGHWLCLNGVRKISPAVARALFQWQGEWISMNGLEELPPGLAKYLPSWGGRQLELMGLKLKNRKSAKDRIGFKYLARWEEAGGKLYVPDEIRQEMK